MVRSIWRGAVSFGLIYVPVEMYSASKDGALSMHLLDSRDFAPVGYTRVNKTTGKEVDWAHIVKGYEYEKGRYVALSDADFKHANAKASETIDISNFCDAADIPAMYYETPYYLSPGKGGAKVYSLLRRALESTVKVAIATFVMRGRQHLCVVTPNGQALMLITLRFANEVLPPSVVKSATEKTKEGASPQEVAMAAKLVAGMSGCFKPEQFKDTYRNDLMRRIKDKIKKKQTHSLEDEDTAADEHPRAQVIDLMEALRNSLKRGGRLPARAAPKKVTGKQPNKLRRRA